MLHPDRLLPPDPGVRRIARDLYDHVRDLPIVSPHGHCDPATLGEDRAVADPAVELVTRDHYLLRMAHSRGVPLEDLGVRPRPGADGGSASGGQAEPVDGRAVWRTFAGVYHLFRATPSKLWLDHTLAEVFEVDVPLGPDTADAVYDELCRRLAGDGFRPRALLDRFGIELLATTDGALDDLEHHRRLAGEGFAGRVVPTFRPDGVTDPDDPSFASNLETLARLTDEDVSDRPGYLAALRKRRDHFVALGATATDHGPPTTLTADLPSARAEALHARVASGRAEPGDAELFRAQALVDMAAMSLDDGLVMQLHAGSWRGHNPGLTARFGPDMGADIPRAMDYVASLKPLLDRFGDERDLTVVVYTLDESAYSRELAPLAGHYPALHLGPPWWFHDSPEGLRRYRSTVTETAGFANTVGFNDDARSLLTIPARHDLARRIDAGFLAGLVAEHRMDRAEAAEVAVDLAHGLASRVFKR